MTDFLWTCRSCGEVVSASVGGATDFVCEACGMRAEPEDFAVMYGTLKFAQDEDTSLLQKHPFAGVFLSEQAMASLRNYYARYLPGVAMPSSFAGVSVLDLIWLLACDWQFLDLIPVHGLQNVGPRAWKLIVPHAFESRDEAAEAQLLEAMVEDGTERVVSLFRAIGSAGGARLKDATVRLLLRIFHERKWAKGIVEYGKAFLADRYGVGRDVSAAIKLFEEAGSEGRHELALCHLRGVGTEVNAKEAMRLFNLDSENPESDSAADSAYQQGLLYLNGAPGIYKDANRAEQCFRISLSRLDDSSVVPRRVDVKVQLADTCFQRRHYSEAVSILEEPEILSNQDFAGHAYRLLGMIYRDGGHGVERDAQKSLESFLTAAKVGDADAVRELAVSKKSLEDSGKESDRKLADEIESRVVARAIREYKSGNWAEALQLAQLSRFEDPVLLEYLGESYLTGHGVETDVTQGVEWLDIAVRAGNGTAAYRLHRIFASGDSVGRDVQRADEYLEKALKLGCPDAVREIERQAEQNYRDGLYASALSGFNRVAGPDAGKANYYMGLIHRDGGDGVVINLELACKCLERALDLGVFGAAGALRSIYEAADTDDSLLKANAVEKRLIGLARDALDRGCLREALDVCALTRLDNAELLYEVARCCYEGNGDMEADKASAAGWLEYAVNADSDEARWFLAQMLLVGDGIQQDVARAEDLLGTAARRGHRLAQREWGRICLKKANAHDSESLRLAVDWFRKAGDVAALDLAECYLNGMGVHPDCHEAIALYELASRSDDISVAEGAASRLADLYMHGTAELRPDYKIARKWLDQMTPLAEEDERLKRFNCAFCDFKLRLYRLARDRFFDRDIREDPRFGADALCGLGVIYREGGDGILHNYEFARRYFEEAIGKGSALAHYELGVMYSRGLGVGKDLKKARELFAEAERLGCPEGGKALAELNHKTGGGALDPIIGVGSGDSVGSLSREDRWALKLLDLSLDNRLINAVEGRNVQYIPEQGAEWVDLKGIVRWLEDDKSVRITPLECKGNDKRSAKEEERLKTEVETRFRGRKLVVIGKKRANQSSFEKVLAKRFDTMLKESITDREGEGTHTLFLALGFLEWTDDEAKKHNAPLVLIPVNMDVPGEEGVCIRKYDDEVQVNHTLLQFLEQRYKVKVQMPEVLPRTATGLTDIMNVFARIQRAIDRLGGGLRIVQTAAIGRFSFESFAMWRDIKMCPDVLKGQPFVKYLMQGGSKFVDPNSAASFAEVRRELSFRKPGEFFCPLAADSSQLTAVLMSEKGRSFVIEGPPGTGKSQTIGNLIAHNLALGKRVLFVAKKDCALQVVRDRLDDVGLEPFYLELRADKKERSKVSRQFLSSFQVRKNPSTARWTAKLAELTQCRAALGDYVDALHKVYPNGFSLYDCILELMCHPEAKYQDLSERITWDCLTESKASFENRVKVLGETFDEFVHTTTREAIALFRDFKRLDLSPMEEQRFTKALQAVIDDCATEADMALLGVYLPDAKVSEGKPELVGFCQKVLDAIEEMVSVGDYLDRRRSSASLDLTGFVELFERGDIADRTSLIQTFELAYQVRMYRALIEDSSSVGPLVHKVSGQKRDPQIKAYRELVNCYRECSKEAVFAKIANLPDFPDFANLPTDLDAQQSEIVAQAKKTRGHTPVRALLEANAKLVFACKRCFLMSPSAVAKFLPMKNDLFDLVIFDEASQIEVCEAIGAMARCRQIIVVGDQKQMPPSQKVGTIRGAGNDEADKDAESILAECEPPRVEGVGGGVLDVGMPSIMLSWHYRSRHESLIEYSNRKYYDCGLHTFPSASNGGGLGLRWVYVEGGLMEHGRNAAEASKIGAYLRKFMTDPEYAKHPKTIGVVAFNAKQKDLIDAVLRAEKRDHPRFAKVYEGIEEPVPKGKEADGRPVEPRKRGGVKFVSNLENVQGDEADVIIFSVTYTPGASGRVTRNLGRLTEVGGERRLNVAVTRAKEQMLVFSSMHGYQMEPKAGEDRQGFIDLSRFLDFVEGYQSVGPTTNGAQGGDAFVASVCAYISEIDFIKEGGYKIRTSVGNSDYKVDIAIVDPKHPGDFLFGIESDGKSYARQLTVEDRDVLRSNQLENSGWNICRVWISEWYHHPKKARQYLHDCLSRIVEIQAETKVDLVAKYLPASVKAIVPQEVVQIAKDLDETEDDEEPIDSGTDDGQDQTDGGCSGGGDPPPIVDLTQMEARIKNELEAKLKAELLALHPVVNEPRKVEMPPVVVQPKPHSGSQTVPTSKRQIPESPPHSSPAKRLPPEVPPPGSSSTCQHPLPETQDSPEFKMKPKALFFDGVLVRATKDWNDFFIALCEKLNSLDKTLFSTLPGESGMAIMFWTRGTKIRGNAKQSDFRLTKLGVGKNVCVSKYAKNNYLTVGTTGRKVLEIFGIDPARITFST